MMDPWVSSEGPTDAREQHTPIVGAFSEDTAHILKRRLVTNTVTRIIVRQLLYSSIDLRTDCAEGSYSVSSFHAAIVIRSTWRSKRVNVSH